MLALLVRHAWAAAARRRPLRSLVLRPIRPRVVVAEKGENTHSDGTVLQRDILLSLPPFIMYTRHLKSDWL